jgi:hypothetical protein
MAVPTSGTLSLEAIAQEALYGTYGSGTITPPIHLYDLVNGGNSAGSGNIYPTVNTACLPNPVTRTVPTITTKPIASITSSTAVSGGTSLVNGVNASDIIAKGIQYSLSSTFSSFTTINAAIVGDGLGSFNSSLTSLNPSTTYYVRAFATNNFGTGYGSVVNFNTLAVPVTGLSWSTTVSNVCNSTPWTISAGNQTIRYDIVDSFNCGGTCSNIQAGTATATIVVGSSAVNLGLDFEGVGEAQNSNFERITFTLNGTQVANANAPGGSLGCVMGPVVKTYTTAPPYVLAANTTHTLVIDFTTADALYHVNAYYEVDLSFS